MHSSIKGWLSVVQLRLGYSQQDGMNGVLELALNEQELAFLIEQLQDAQTKLKILADQVPLVDGGKP